MIGKLTRHRSTLRGGGVWLHCFYKYYLTEEDLGGMFPIEWRGVRILVLIDDQANAGDSRSVLGVKGRAKPLSFDHKPQNEGEYTTMRDVRYYIRESGSDK